MTSLFDRYLQESDAFSAKNKTPELSRAQRLLKMFLVGVNVVFLIFACVLMGVGSVAYTRNVGPIAGQTIPQGIIAMGVFIMFLSFMGCFGAWKENRLALGCYFFFLLLCTILLLAIGIGVMAKKDEAGYYMTQGWGSANSGTRETLQNSFSCCGLNSYGPTDPLNAVLPCPNITSPTSYCNTLVNGYYECACLNSLISAFNSSYNDLGATGVSFAVFMFIGMVAVCYLTRAIRLKAEVAAGDTEKIDSIEDSSSPTTIANESQQQSQP